MSFKYQISVIIPVYNDQAGLDFCLEGLNKQTIPSSKFEIIIIDNGSYPNLQIVDYPNLQINFISCMKKGSYAARNAGIKVALGEYIAFLDADCQPIEKWLEIGLRTLKNNPTKTVIAGNVSLIPSQNPSIIEQYQCLTGFGQKENVEINQFAATANIFVKYENINEIGLFDDRLLSGGDREWSWRAKQCNYNIIYSSEALVYTHPRKTLTGAIKQARRVAGGRYKIKQLKLITNPIGLSKLAPRRKIFESIYWILKQSQLNIITRVKLLGIASFLKLIQFYEAIRLKLGNLPERC